MNIIDEKISATRLKLCSIYGFYIRCVKGKYLEG
jgi:hypothetical protein